MSIKVLEVAVFNRVMSVLEPTLNSQRFVCRKSRATKAHVLGVNDFVTAQTGAGRHVYLASLDVDGAFDIVPHSHLIRPMAKANIEPSASGFALISIWLRNR